MKFVLYIFFISFQFRSFAFQELCSFAVSCDKCYPDYLPTIESHEPVDNEITIPHGHEATLNCHKAKFKLYPEENLIKAICHHGLFKIRNEFANSAELGCKTDYFEDVLHQVDACRGPHQGRSYQYLDSTQSAMMHLAEVCYEPETGRTVFARMTFANRNNIVSADHSHRANRMSILEGFSTIMDDSAKLEAEKVYDDDEKMFHRMKHLIDHKFNFADHKLISTKLLPSEFFYKQNGLVSKFPSNRVATWSSVVEGNLKHIRDDILGAFRGKNSSDSIDVYVGTHDVLALQVNRAPKPIYLKPGKKYPVPKYIYTVVHNRKEQKAVVLILINNPFVSISEVRGAVFCPSMCSSINWLRSLKMDYNFERTAYGIVFCCDVHSFGNAVGDAPDIAAQIAMAERGILKNGVN